MKRLLLCFIFVLAFLVTGHSQTAGKVERQGLLKAITQSESAFFRDQVSSYGGSDQVAREMKVKKVTSKTGLNLYIVDQVMGYSACGSNGECQAWVLEKFKNEYRLLLTESGLRFAPTSTNGYRDLTQSYGAGVYQSDFTYISSFKFENARYVKSCYKQKRAGRPIKIPCV
jgi:hypothetical protein